MQGVNYLDFPTDKFRTGNENTGAMNAAPVFFLVAPSAIFCSRLQGWLENALDDPRILIAANGLEELPLAAQEQRSQILIEMHLLDTTSFEVVRQMRLGPPAARIIATGWYESPFFLERVRSAGADGFILRHKLHSELLPLLRYL